MNTPTPNTMSQEDANRIVQTYGNRAERRRWEKIKRKRATEERTKAQRKHSH